MPKGETQIIAGAGDGVQAALQTFNNQLSQQVKGNDFEIKFFTMYTETKMHPMDPRSMQITHYAIAIVIVQVKTAAEMFAEQ